MGDYPHDRKAFGITVNVGGFVFKTDPKNVNFLVELVNRDTYYYLLRSYNNLPLSDTIPIEHISWQLDDETGNALTNDSLKSAPIPPILENWKDSYGLTITGGAYCDLTQSFLCKGSHRFSKFDILKDCLTNIKPFFFFMLCEFLDSIVGLIKHTDIVSHFRNAWIRFPFALFHSTMSEFLFYHRRSTQITNSIFNHPIKQIYN